MATSARRQPDSVTGLGRRGQERWAPRDRPTFTHSALSAMFSHSTIILFSVGWMALAYVVYVAFTTDQARSGTWGCELPRMLPIYRRLEPPIPGSRYDTYLYREGGWDPEIVRWLKVELLLTTADRVSRDFPPWACRGLQAGAVRRSLCGEAVLR